MIAELVNDQQIVLRLQILRFKALKF